MPNFDEKPTAAFIDQARVHLRDQWGPCHTGWDTRDTFYHRNYDLWPHHTDRPKTYPSRPTAIVDRAADTLINFTPNWHRVSRKPDQTEGADSIEVAGRTIMEDSALREMVLPFSQMWLHLIHYQYAIIEVGFDWQSRPVEPKREKGETDDEFAAREVRFRVQKDNWNPIRIRAPDPRTVLMDPEQKQPPCAIQLQGMPAHELETLTRRKANPGPRVRRQNVNVFHVVDHKDMGPFDTVNLVHYWTKDYHSVKLADGEILWTERNPWGFVRFAHAYARAGIMPHNGSVKGGFNPAFIARGMLEPVEDELRMAAQGTAARHKLGVDAAFALVGTETLSPEELAEAEKVGGYVQANKDSVWVVQTPQVQNWMFQQAQEIDLGIDRGTFTDILSGFRQQGVSTVGQHALQSQAANRQFQTPIIQLEHLASIGGQMMLQMVLVLDELSTFGQIGINGKILKASEIGHDTSVRITFSDINPALALQAKESDRRDFELGLMSEEDFIRQHHSEDVTGWSQRIDETRLWRRPALVEVRADDVAARLGVEDELRRARELEQQQTDRARSANEVPNPAEGQPIPESTTNPLRQSLDGATQNPARQ
jgi:hypothetical protein